MHPSVTNQRLSPTMKFSSVATWFAAGLLMSAQQASAVHKDENGANVYTEQDMNAMLSPAEREKLIETMARARNVVRAEHRRQRRMSPKDSYVPAKVPCPKKPEGNNYVNYVRNASDHRMNELEQGYMQRHRDNTRSLWVDWLKSVGLDGDGGLPGGAEQFVSENQPKVGISVSGGGYRAMLVALGVSQGFDSRNETSKNEGVGGFLQLADYYAGLSGGSWATGAQAINGWPTAQSLVDDIMELSSNLVNPNHDSLSFYEHLFKDVGAKKHADFPISISDYWGRALSYQLMNDTQYPDHGQRITYSDIVNQTGFRDATYPFPIVLSIGRQPDQIMINPNATYFEFTPYEFGTWQPTLEAFFPVGYLGTDVVDGNPKDGSSCIANYENFGYTVGTSSTLFNGAYNKLLESNSTGFLNDVLKTILEDVDKGYNDVAPVPNPFKGYRQSSNHFVDAKYIDLVDGGEANQNIPLEPLLQPARGLDLIVAVDASSDQVNWPNGTALIEVEKRSNLSEFSYMAFPRVPDARTFVNRGFNTRPTFFGCDPNDATNAKTSVGNSTAPVLIYLPNYPYSGFSNSSTFELAYNVQHQHDMLDNARNVATMGGQMDNWPLCLACASALRPMQRSGAKIPDKCQQCMDMYCWDGKYDTSPTRNYTPPVGPPPFVTSHGQKSVEPPTTGSNDSTDTDYGKIISSKDKSAAAPMGVSSAVFTSLFLASLLAMFMN